MQLISNPEMAQRAKELRFHLEIGNGIGEAIKLINAHEAPKSALSTQRAWPEIDGALLRGETEEKVGQQCRDFAVTPF